MAKKTGKAKKTGVRIPKTIAGVKIPKEARRAGEALIEKAQTPAGQQMIASGLAMAATAAAAVAARRAREAPPAPSPAVAPVRPGDGGAADGVADMHHAADAIGRAAEAMLSRLFGASRPG